MLYAKKNIFIFITTTMLSFFPSVFAMKDNELIIEKITQKDNDILTSLSNFFHVSFLNDKQISTSFFLDNKTIVFYSNNTIEIWDIIRNKCLKRFIEKKITDLIKLTNTSILFKTNKGHITIWDTNLNIEKTFKIKKTSLFDTDYRLLKLTTTTIAAIHEDGTIQVWNIKDDPKCIQTTNDAPPFTYVERLSNTKIIFATKNNNIKTYDLETKISKIIEMNFKTLPCNITCLLKNAEQSYAFGFKRPENIEFSREEYAHINIFNTNSDTFYQRIDTKLTPYFLFNLPRHNAIISVGKDNIIEIWDLQKPAIKVQSIAFPDFLKNELIVSMDYFEEENILAIITNKGSIITYTCVESTHGNTDSFLESVLDQNGFFNKEINI